MGRAQWVFLRFQLWGLWKEITSAFTLHSPAPHGSPWLRLDLDEYKRSFPAAEASSRLRSRND